MPFSPGRQPVQAAAQEATIPAPAGGLNAMAPGTAVPPGDCLDVWNMIASENGLRTRLGYREWCVDLTGNADNKVRSLLSFSGSEPSQNRLFATTDTFIFDVTASTDAPLDVLAFANSSGFSGYGVGRAFTTSGGHFYLYCDEVNGLHVYAESGATWSAPTMGGGPGQLDNVDPVNLVHVVEFKQRLWFTERDSASAWYLPAGQLYGSATEFNFGTHFSQGGYLVGLYTWSYDGGSGMDDALVAVSSSGDIVIYQGVDPASSSSFNKRGTWSLAPPPAGREVAAAVGGDLWILSGTGLMPLSRLVVGADTKQAETVKIGNLFNRLMLTRKERRGWSMRLHPEDNALVLLYPDYSTEANRQLVQALGAPGRPWFRYRGVPMHCAAVWEGRLHFGTQDGRVCVSRDDVDNVSLSDSNSYGPIEWQLLTAFQKSGGRTMQVHLMRPLFSVDGGAPDYSIEARYGFDLSGASAPDAAAAQPGSWDNAIWDTDVWGGDASPHASVRGGSAGLGHSVAIALRGSSVARTTLVEIDVLYEVGGWL